MALTYLAGNLVRKGYARVQVRDGLIAAVEIEGPERDGAPFLSPGLVDIQLNGFAGIDFSAPDLEPEAAIAVLPHLTRTGTLSFCPTLITNAIDRIARNFRVLERARSADARFAAMVPCYHLEGPYFAPGPARGVHDPSYMHPPDWDEFCTLQDAAGGRIGIVTLAPELPGAIDFIARLRDAGVVAALGHTMATPEQIHAAVDSGARLSTHLGNGCPQMLDRHANPIWAQLVRGELMASLICDGFHLPADVVKVMARMKGAHGTILITDASHVAGLPPGRYSMVGTEIELLATGKVIRADGGSLAGSALSMDRAVAMFRQLSGLPWEDALAAATANPAALLGKGVCRAVAPGQPANLIQVETDAGTLRVQSTHVAVEQASAN